MKKISFLVLLVGIIMFASCSKDGISYKSDFEKSYITWLNFKKNNTDSYRYRVDGVSWTGWRWQTIITVTKGEVTGRSYERKYQDEIEEGWTEIGDELGTHNMGAELLTMDQIYDKARNEWLIDRENAEVFFERDKKGLISVCGYVENGCMDDCFVGIRIGYVEPR